MRTENTVYFNATIKFGIMVMVMSWHFFTKIINETISNEYEYINLLPALALV